MNYKRFVGAILVIVILCVTLVSCGSPPPGGNPSSEGAPSSGSEVSEFEVIRQAADAYLSSGKADKTFLGKDLHDIITDDNPKNNPRIMEVRNFAQHALGHICGAVNAPWRQLFLTLTPKRLDKYFTEHDKTSDNKQIVVYSYTGQEGGGQTTAFLNMMGYDAINLKWGYNVWQFCSNASPGTFFPATLSLQQVTMRSMVGFNPVGQNYPTEATINEALKTYEFPVVENTESEDPSEIIRVAAAKWAGTEEPLTAEEISWGGSEQKHIFKDTEINPVDLFNLLHDSDPQNNPFILSVQEPELYAKGHVPGAIRIPLTDVTKPDNLRKLPPDRQIVVVSSDGMSGNQVAGILCILGYNAVNLKFGMTAWTRDEDIAPGRFNTWEPGSTSVYKDVLAYEVCWIEQAVTETIPPIEGWQPPPSAAAEIPPP